jgi:hypothetical protein
MSGGRPNPFGCFDRRFAVELIPALAAMVAALAIAGLLPRSEPTRLLMAGLSSGALAWTIIVAVAAIRRLDELQQRIHLIAIAVSFAATGALLAMTLFFKVAGVGWFPSGLVLSEFMLAVWAGGVVVLEHRYR